MTVTSILKSELSLPNNWHNTLAARVEKLPVPELSNAFSDAEAILDGRTETEVQKMAESLWQSIANTQGEKQAEIVLDPRTIYGLYSNSLVSKPPRSVSVVDSLAIGTLVALDRACNSMDAIKNKASWLRFAREISAARVFGEWIYMLSSFSNQEHALELLFPGQVRTAAKKKISKKASRKSKKKWAEKLEPEKQKVINAYEAGKPWKNVKAAAAKIHDDAVTNAVMYDKLYKWLLAYEKQNKK